MRIRTVTLALVAIAVAGSLHARDDQGINDYAKAYWNPDKSCVPFVRKYESVCGPNFSGDPVDEDGKRRGFDTRASASNCKNLSEDQKPGVQRGQNISIYLNQAFIHDFTERWEGFLGSKRGEIAVVARVAELDEKNDFDFTAAGKDKGRLVYYSEGVQPRQFLNFSQVPVYGPVEYTGRPLMMEFYIIELDVKEGTEVSGLLSAVAGLGSIAYPPASPILKVLDTIGGGLLKANKNDLEFKYHAALLGGAMQISSLKAGTLEYGNYVFVRMPGLDAKAADTSSLHPWSNWWFNQKNARLYTDKNCRFPEQNRTYFSMQINRAKEVATLDSANTFANFATKLNAEANASLAEKVKVIDALKDNVAENKRYQDAKKLIDHASAIRWPDGKSETPKPLDAATKGSIDELAKKVENALRNARGEKVTGEIAFGESRAYTLVEALGRLAGTKKFAPQSFTGAALSAEIN